MDPLLVLCVMTATFGTMALLFDMLTHHSTTRRMCSIWWHRGLVRDLRAAAVAGGGGGDDVTLDDYGDILDKDAGAFTWEWIVLALAQTIVAITITSMFATLFLYSVAIMFDRVPTDAERRDALLAAVGFSAAVLSLDVVHGLVQWCDVCGAAGDFVFGADDAAAATDDEAQRYRRVQRRESTARRETAQFADAPMLWIVILCTHLATVVNLRVQGRFAADSPTAHTSVLLIAAAVFVGCYAVVFLVRALVVWLIAREMDRDECFAQAFTVLLGTIQRRYRAAVFVNSVMRTAVLVDAISTAIMVLVVFDVHDVSLHANWSVMFSGLVTGLGSGVLRTLYAYAHDARRRYGGDVTQSLMSPRIH